MGQPSAVKAQQLSYNRTLIIFTRQQVVDKLNEAKKHCKLKINDYRKKYSGLMIAQQVVSKVY